MSFLKKLIKKKRRIVLITSPSSFPVTYARSPFFPFSLVPVNIATPLLPLGPAYIASSLEEAGYEVLVLDCTFMDKKNFDAEKIKTTILSLNPDLIGLTALTWTILNIYDLANNIKKEDSETPIILGGPHVSALPYRTLDECKSIDGVIIGEGEQTFPLFLKSLFSKGINDELKDFKGLVVRNKNQFIGDPEPVYIENLDEIPFPARHLFPVSEYIRYSKNFKAKQKPVASMITSRGCPHKCTFCTRVNNGSIHRARSPSNVVEEMEELKKLGFNEIQIVDDNFTHDRKRVFDICELIKNKNLQLTFSLVNGMRIDHVTEEMMKTMYDSGFYSIHFGVESADNQILKKIKKAITIEQVRNAIKITRNIGYDLNLFFVIGLPGSNVESEEKTLTFIEEMGLPFTYSVCTPYPGSPLWNELGDKMDSITWDRFDEGDVSNPLYLPENMTLDEIKNIINRAKELQNSMNK
ncbi:B12-binding domain-containing radical SAM protein [Candidatus Bathyarchaeota archaeon]|nr:B12-binding domain-containing radical SAM protein [Candidatus Bathyarchaeota archaeon]